MKILITGANGMLGSALYPELLADKHEILATDITGENNDIIYLDVRDRKSVAKIFESFRPDIVFHLAAATDVDRCEVQKEEAFITNALGTENVVLSCIKKDTTLVYISTAAVFDGEKKEPYTEFDHPNPLSIYAKTKLEGEKTVQLFLKKYFIIRAGWMIGGIDKDKKFVFKIIKQLQNQKEISAVTDKIGSPTFNKGSCSRYDIAKMIVKFMGRDDITVKPVTSEAFPLRAPRPDSEAIDNFKLNLLGMNNMPSWERALEEYTSIIKSNNEWAKVK